METVCMFWKLTCWRQTAMCWIPHLLPTAQSEPNISRWDGGKFAHRSSHTRITGIEPHVKMMNIWIIRKDWLLCNVDWIFISSQAVEGDCDVVLRKVGGALTVTAFKCKTEGNIFKSHSMHITIWLQKHNASHSTLKPDCVFLFDHM